MSQDKLHNLQTKALGSARKGRKKRRAKEEREGWREERREGRKEGWQLKWIQELPTVKVVNLNLDSRDLATLY